MKTSSPRHIAKLINESTDNLKKSIDEPIRKIIETQDILAKNALTPPWKKIEFWITIFFGVFAIGQAIYIACQAQTIKDFDKLLKKVDTQTQTLSDQLAINQKSEKTSTAIYYNKKRAKANQLLAAVNSINTIISDVKLVVKENASLQVKDYLPLMKDIMKVQLDNNFLMENTGVSNSWVESEILLDKSITYINQQYHIGTGLTNQQAYDRCIPTIIKCMNQTEKYCKDNLN